MRGDRASIHGNHGGARTAATTQRQRLADAGARLRQHALQPADRNHDREREAAQASVPLCDIATGQSTTSAPLVVKGKVLVGNNGCELGVRGWLTALDAATGKQLWRAYSTGPDDDVLIGANFKPFYAQDRGKDLGVKTWP